MEGAISDHLGVQTAIVGEVNLLGHQAVEGGANVSYFCPGVDRKSWGLGEKCAETPCDGRNCEEKTIEQVEAPE